MAGRRADSWVVYRRPIKGCPGGVNAVCETSEWDAMVRDRPGFGRRFRARVSQRPGRSPTRR
jgi:hypothetical protein